jgi:hypothetical protein
VSRTLTRVDAVAVVLVRGREVRMPGRLDVDANGEMHEDWTRQHWRIQPAAWSLLT